MIDKDQPQLPGGHDPLHILELNHVAIHVRDLAASEHFYGTILGLQRLARPAFGFEGAWFALGSQELHLIADTQNQDKDRASYHFALRVDDAAAARAVLLARGIVDISGANPRPDGVYQVFLRDPDGYEIELMSE